MSDISDSNQGPGWNDHDTPTGTIHSYDGNTVSGSSSASGGNAGNSHTGITDSTKINIASTKDYSGTYMTMCVGNLKRHEGFKNKMYKDTKGNITVGVGHLLATADMAAALPFTHTVTKHGHGDDMESEVAVSTDNIKAAFNSFKTTSTPPDGFHLSNDAVIGQCIKDVQDTETGLRGLYSNYDNFSDQRKTAIVDMGFNLGVPRLKNEFPSFNDAVNRGDWAKAATESHRVGISDARNNDTHNQLL